MGQVLKSFGLVTRTLLSAHLAALPVCLLGLQVGTQVPVRPTAAERMIAEPGSAGQVAGNLPFTLCQQNTRREVAGQR